MNFTISYNELTSLMKAVGLSRPTGIDILKISALDSRVFVEFRGVTAGIECITISDGEVSLPAKKFGMVFATYKGTPMLTFRAGPEHLQIQNLTMPHLAWNPSPLPPAKFKIFPTQQAPSDIGHRPGE